MPRDERPILTERTAKRYKAVQGVGVLLLVAGGVLAVLVINGSVPVGMERTATVAAKWVAIAGAAAALVGGVLGWWNHE